MILTDAHVLMQIFLMGQLSSLFCDTPALGNIQHNTLQSAYDKWMESSLAKTLNCHCPAVNCLGPNILVKNSYYKDIDFTKLTSNL